MRIRILAALAAFAIGNGSVVSAQEQLGYYLTQLGLRDMYNSQGERLQDFCQIVQQDRANFHRFGIRDIYDTDDPFFRTAEARQVISRLCVVPPEFDYVRRDVMDGYPYDVWVEVYGSGGRITAVVVTEAGG